MDDNRKTYYIGDLARDLGLSQRAIRYYEELGFIKPSRTDGGFRTYCERDVDLLRTVLQFKELGMSLDEIRALFIPGQESLTGEAIRHLRETLLARRQEIESRIKVCEDGIRQIDRVLAILTDCPGCGKPADAGVCDACLKEHGGDAAPLIHPLLSREQGAKG